MLFLPALYVAWFRIKEPTAGETVKKDLAVAASAS
jgi:hypothetical protein